MAPDRSIAEGLPMVRWRAMTEADLVGVIALADRVHPDFPEGEAMYRDRMRLFPGGCLVLADDAGAIVGYAVAYPARLGSPPPLDTVLGRLPNEADALYLHDVALAPEWRGGGRSGEGIARLLALAAAFPAAMLVSVYGTAPFWARHGFRAVDGEAMAAKLRAYGPTAVYMVRDTAECREARPVQENGSGD
ncbi:GNAT family N-acetyltransferase [Aureimonas pseudogalii]|uniref:Putative N-acetyltransferase YhbS n=2 Tax=Aureimonas pseudogalii TaxID=1744844 RepID=A0A7W6H3B9_9HYPH|nr:GNAT family N-acetyltransferase [Aureimonas pseudogalii]MBB3997007.1 putative N-acetyltransferase YhbS [Aureimonas pseudogalii]